MYENETMALAQAMNALITAIVNAQSTSVKAEAPAPQPTPVAPPVTPPAAPLTHDDVRAKLLPMIQMSKEAMTEVQNVLHSFGVEALSKLPAEKLPEFMAKVNEATTK